MCHVVMSTLPYSLRYVCMCVRICVSCGDEHTALLTEVCMYVCEYVCHVVMSTLPYSLRYVCMCVSMCVMW